MDKVLRALCSCLTTPSSFSWMTMPTDSCIHHYDFLVNGILFSPKRRSGSEQICCQLKWMAGQCHASKVLMKGLPLARLCRPDISFSVDRLASRITVWSRAEDVHLHRVHWTKEYQMVCQAGSLSDTELPVYADADLASCVHTARSNSGMMIMLT